jgi:hypothetical protein
MTQGCGQSRQVTNGPDGLQQRTKIHGRHSPLKPVQGRKDLPPAHHPIAAEGRDLTIRRSTGKIPGMNPPITVMPLLLVFALPAVLEGQVADSGAFLVRHGRDTVATEHFTRTGVRLEGTLSLRNAKGTFERYAAVVAPDATVPLIEVTVQEGADTGEARPKILQRARVIFKEDSAAVDEIGRAGLVTRVLGTERGAIPYLNLSFALIEQAVRRAKAANGGSSVPFFNLGGGQTLVAKLSPLSPDSVLLDIGDTRYHLKLDPRGKLLGARIPQQDVVVDRQ